MNNHKNTIFHQLESFLKIPLVSPLKGLLPEDCCKLPVLYVVCPASTTGRLRTIGFKKNSI